MEDFIRQCIKDSSSKYSKLKEKYVSELNDCYIAVVRGGLNGFGKSRDYLSDLIDLLDNLEEKAKDASIIDFYIDNLKDTFIATIKVDF